MAERKRRVLTMEMLEDRRVMAKFNGNTIEWQPGEQIEVSLDKNGIILKLVSDRSKWDKPSGGTLVNETTLRVSNSEGLLTFKPLWKARSSVSFINSDRYSYRTDFHVGSGEVSFSGKNTFKNLSFGLDIYKLTVNEGAQLNVKTLSATMRSGVGTAFQGWHIAGKVKADAVNIETTGSEKINLGGDDNSEQLGLSVDELKNFTVAQQFSIKQNTTFGRTKISQPISLASPVTRIGSTTEVNFDAGEMSMGNLVIEQGRVIFGKPGVDVKQSLQLGSNESTTLVVTINGKTPDTEYQRLQVNGSVDLTNVGLSLSGLFMPARGDSFTIVTGSEIRGTFRDMPEGATISLNNRNLKISYVATEGKVTAVTLTDVSAGAFSDPKLLIDQVPQKADGSQPASTQTLTDFGVVKTAGRYTRVVTIKNEGGAYLVLNGPGDPVTISGSPMFRISRQPDRNVFQAWTTTFEVELIPTATLGPVSATISIPNNSTTQSVLKLNFAATVVGGDVLAAGATFDYGGTRAVFLGSSLKAGDGTVSTNGKVQIGSIPQGNAPFVPLLETSSAGEAQTVIKPNGAMETTAELVAPTINGAATGYKPITLLRAPVGSESRTTLALDQLTNADSITSDRFAKIAILDALFYTPTRLRFGKFGAETRIELRGGLFTDADLPPDVSFSFGDREDVNKDGNKEIHPTDYLVIDPTVPGGRGISTAKLKYPNSYPSNKSINLNQPRPENPIAPGVQFYVREAGLSWNSARWTISGTGTGTLGNVQMPVVFRQDKVGDTLSETGRIQPPTQPLYSNITDRSGASVPHSFVFAGASFQADYFRTTVDLVQQQVEIFWTKFSSNIPGGSIVLQVEPEGPKRMILKADGTRTFKFPSPGFGESKMTLGGFDVRFDTVDGLQYDPANDAFVTVGDVLVDLANNGRNLVRLTPTAAKPLKITRGSFERPNPLFPNTKETVPVPQIDVVEFTVPVGVEVPISSAETLKFVSGGTMTFDPRSSVWSLRGVADYTNASTNVTGRVNLNGNQLDGTPLRGIQFSDGRVLGGSFVFESLTANGVSFTPEQPRAVVGTLNNIATVVVLQNTNPVQTETRYSSVTDILGPATISIQGVVTKVSLGGDGTKGIRYARKFDGNVEAVTDFAIYPADPTKFIQAGGVWLSGKSLRGTGSGSIVTIGGETEFSLPGASFTGRFRLRIKDANEVDASTTIVSMNMGGIDFTLITNNPLVIANTTTRNKLQLFGAAKVALVENRKTDVFFDLVNGVTIENGAFTQMRFRLKDFGLGKVVFSEDKLVADFSAARNAWVVTGDTTMRLDGVSFPITFGGNGTTGLVFDNNGLRSIDFYVRNQVTIQGIVFPAGALKAQYEPSTETYTLIGSGSFNGAIGDETVTLGTDPTKPQYTIEKGVGRLKNFRPSDTCKIFAKTTAFICTNNLDFRFEGGASVYRGTTEITSVYDYSEKQYLEYKIQANFGAGTTQGIVIRNAAVEAVSGEFLEIATNGNSQYGFRVVSGSQTGIVSGNQNELKVDAVGAKLILGTGINGATPQPAGGRDGDVELPAEIVFRASRGPGDKVDLSWLTRTQNASFSFGGVKVKSEGGFFKYNIDYKTRFDMLGWWRVEFNNQINERVNFQPGNTIVNSEALRFDIRLTQPITIGGTVLSPAGATFSTYGNFASYDGKFNLPVFNGMVGTINVTNKELELDPTTGELNLNTLRVNIPSAAFGSTKSKAGKSDKKFTFKGMEFTYQRKKEVDPKTGIETVKNIATGRGTIVLKSGIELGAMAEIVDGNLSSVGIFAEGDRLFTLGGLVTITKVEGRLENLDDAENFKVVGEVSAVIGGQVTIFGRKVNLVEATGRLEISKTELTIGGDVLIAKGLFGRGSGSVRFFFDSDSLYVVLLNANYRVLPGDILRGDLEFKLARSGDVDFDGSIGVYLPNQIPVVGGFKVASARVEVRIRPSQPLSNSYVFGQGCIAILGCADAKADFSGRMEVGINPLFAGRFSFSFYLPGTRSIEDYDSPLYTTEFIKPSAEVLSITPIPGTSKATVTYRATVDPLLEDVSTIDLFVDTSNSGHQGVLIAEALPYAPGTQTFIWEDFAEFAPIPYDPKHQIFVYADVNDSENFTEFSNYSPPVIPPDFTPSITLPSRQQIDAGRLLTFSATTGNPISILDPLLPQNPDEQLELIVDSNYGVLTVPHLPDSVTLTGEGSTRLRFYGTAVDITAALDGLTYTPFEDTYNDDSLYFSLTRSPAEFTTRLDANLEIGVNPLVITVGGHSNSDPAKDDFDYTQSSGPVEVFSDINIYDPSGIFGTQAAVTINGYVPGEDLLTFDNLFTPDINGQWDAHRGVLTLKNYSRVDDFARALQSVRFSTTGEGSGKSLTVSLVDDLGERGSFDLPIDIAPINEAPQIDVNDTTVVHLPSMTSAVIAPRLSLSEPDGHTIASALVAFDINDYHPGEDLLTFNDTETITSSFDSVTGTLTLTGLASAVEYQAALRKVTYRNVAATPTAGFRVLHFSVNDMAEAVGETIARLGVLDALSNYESPSLSLNVTSVTPASGHEPTTLAPSLTISSPSLNTLLAARVRIASNYSPGEDVLSVSDSDLPPGILSAFDAETGELILFGDATWLDYQAALRSVTYSNLSDIESGDVRVIEFTLDDGLTTSPDESLTLDIAAEPELELGSSYVEYSQAKTSIALLPELTLANDERATLSGATVHIEYGYLADQDRLQFTNQRGISGSLDETTGELTLSGVASVGDYQVALRSITYRNLRNNPDAGYRMINVSVADGGLSSETETAMLFVDALPDGPSIAVDASADVFAERGTPLTIVPDFTLRELDPVGMFGETHLYGASISIGNYVEGEDLLDYSPVAGISGITGEFDAEQGVLFLYGHEPISTYQAIIRTITYQNISGSPSEEPRTIEITLNDGIADEEISQVTTPIVIHSLKDPPTRSTGTTAPITVLENELPVSLGLDDVAYNAPPLPAAQIAAGVTSDLVFRIVELPDESLAQIVLPDGSPIDAEATYTLSELRSMRVQPAFGQTGVAQFRFSVAAREHATGKLDPAALTETVSITIVGADADTDDERYVAQLYRDLLHRNATTTELQAGVDLLSITSDSASLVTSLLSRDESRPALVNRVYQVLLGRDATPAEQTQFTTLDSNSAQSLRLRLIASDEFFQPFSTTGANGQANYINVAVQLLLGREATRNEIQNWSDKVATAAQRLSFTRAIADDDAALEHWARSLFHEITRQPPTHHELADALASLVASGDNGLLANIVTSSSYRSIFTSSSGVIDPFTASEINDEATDDFENVGQINGPSGLIGGGTLISDRTLVTAAHVLDGKSPNDLSVTFGDKTYAVTQFVLHPDYDASLLGHEGANDIALLELSENPEGIEPAILERRAPQPLDVITLVGYGTRGGNAVGVRRAGETPIEFVSPTMLHWTFDNLTESSTAPGDSGGGLFTSRGDMHLLAGVISGGSRFDGTLGDSAYNTRVDVYIPWIETFTGPLPTIHAPRNVSLGNLTFTNSAAVGTIVGQFAIDDEDLSPDTIVQLVAGEGDRDNAYFTIRDQYLILKQTIPVPLPAELQLRVRVTDETGESIEKTLALDPLSRWQNVAFPNDCDSDGTISPTDALLIINYLNQYGSEAPRERNGQMPAQLDVDGDGLATPTDALLIINYLNRRLFDTESAGEATLVTTEPPAFYSSLETTTDSEGELQAATTDSSNTESQSPSIAKSLPTLLSQSPDPIQRRIASKRPAATKSQSVIPFLFDQAIASLMEDED